MAPRVQILRSSIPQEGIDSIRSLKYGPQIEAEIVPLLGAEFKDWMLKVARDVAADWPKRGGASQLEIIDSSRVTMGSALNSIHGYFIVSDKIVANEFGTKVRGPRNAEVITIPVYYGLYPDGRPKRLGPNSWRYLGTFWYHSKRTGQLYLAYKTKADGLKLIYIGVRSAGAIKPLKKFAEKWQSALPSLQGTIGQILKNAVDHAYLRMFDDAANSIDGNLVMQRRPTIFMPNVGARVEKLTPRFDQ